MSVAHNLQKMGPTILFVALSILSVGLTASLRPVSAAPTGTYFDHIVIIAMENSAYQSVFGSGTLSSCPTGSAPFLCSMLPVSSTIPSMNNYGATSADTNDFNGCSAACYVGLMFGYTYGVSDGYPLSSINSNPQFVNSLSSAGLTWQAYCESGCPRGADHFPFSGSNAFKTSSVSTSDFVSAANSASPPNFLWYTPTDSNNMHDVSVSTGDSYLQSFLVGSGSISSPASGSLLASNVFTNPNYRTVLYLWWDECGGHNGSCDGNNDAPNLLYGTPVKKGYVSPDTTGIDEYASIWTIENNWGFAPLGQGDTAAKSNNYQFNDIFNSGAPQPLSASFTYLPSSPTAGSTVTFTATASGGTAPYSYSWSYGDGSTGSGVTATHAYSSSGSYTATLTVTDSAGGSSKPAQTVQVAPVSALTGSFTYLPSTPITNTPVSFTAVAAGGTAPYSYSWSFGDGSSSTGQTSTHSYGSTGSYTVTLTVTDSASGSVQSTQTVQVSPVPAFAASFSFTPTTPVSGQSVTFTATATGGTSPYSYSWNLAGTAMTGNPVSLSFSSGTFSVSVTVTDAGGQTATSSQSLTVQPSTTGSGQYTLSFQGYDFDGASEETLTVNGNLVASIPPVLTAANGGTWASFSFDITSFVVNGANTVSFTHAGFDCSVVDQVRNLAVTDQTVTIYSNSTPENIDTATNCTNTLTYTFTVGGSAGVLPVIAVPGPQNATVGGTLHFTVSGNYPTGTAGSVTLSA
ncbi:PKD domain-containing protein, partial [Candidatus Bathyarchaeota archaeon]|nr:PKD domain-containing protein [Candidatus Bathyarchaeota archaeon]